MCLAEGTVLCERHKKLMHQRFRGRELGVVRYFSPAGHPTPYDGAVAHRWNTIFLGKRREAGGLLFSEFGRVRVVMTYWVRGPSPGKWIAVSANTPPLGTPHCAYLLRAGLPSRSWLSILTITVTGFPRTDKFPSMTDRRGRG